MKQYGALVIMAPDRVNQRGAELERGPGLKVYVLDRLRFVDGAPQAVDSRVSGAGRQRSQAGLDQRIDEGSPKNTGRRRGNRPPCSTSQRQRWLLAQLDKENVFRRLDVSQRCVEAS